MTAESKLDLDEIKMTKKDEVIHSGHFMIANVHDGPDASAVSFKTFLSLFFR